MAKRQKNTATEIERAERRLFALEKRRDGWSFDRIGDALGVSRQAAHGLVRRQIQALNEETPELADEIRTLDLELLNRLTAEALEHCADWTVTNKQGIPIPLIAMIQIRANIERRARLLGYDAKTPSDAAQEKLADAFAELTKRVTRQVLPPEQAAKMQEAMAEAMDDE